MDDNEKSRIPLSSTIPKMVSLEEEEEEEEEEEGGGGGGGGGGRGRRGGGGGGRGGNNLFTMPCFVCLVLF